MSPPVQEQPRCRVLVYIGRPEDLGQQAEAAPPGHVDLEQSVLGDVETMGQEEIGGVLGEPVRHAPPVVDQLHRLAQPGHGDHRAEAVGVMVVIAALTTNKRRIGPPRSGG
jgi:hypothetical protein